MAVNSNLNTERGGSFKICLLKFMCINVDSYTISLFLSDISALKCACSRDVSVSSRKGSQCMVK